MAEKSRASLIGCRRGLEVVRDGLVEVHRNLQEEVPDAQVAAEEARRLEPGKESGQIVFMSSDFSFFLSNIN